MHGKSHILMLYCTSVEWYGICMMFACPPVVRSHWYCDVTCDNMIQVCRNATFTLHLAETIWLWGANVVLCASPPLFVKGSSTMIFSLTLVSTKMLLKIAFAENGSFVPTFWVFQNPGTDSLWDYPLVAIFLYWDNCMGLVGLHYLTAAVSNCVCVYLTKRWLCHSDNVDNGGGFAPMPWICGSKSPPPPCTYKRL